ncbi:hypothetical protein Tco_0360408 [Tanacetum coccineum]
MCRRQGYMIQNMAWKCVTTKQFWKTHKQVNQVLREGVSQLVEKDTEDLIENNLKPCIAATIIKDRDAFRSEVPYLVSQEFNAQAPKIIEELFKNYVQSSVIQVYPTTTTSTKTTSSADLQHKLYLKMKRSLHDQANDPALWEVLKRNFEKSSTSNTSCRDSDIHSYHDDHQEDDAPPEGEKRQQQQQQEWDAWVEETVVDEDEVIPEDVSPELITEFQQVDKRVPTIFDRARIEATLNDALSNQFTNAEEYAYHLERSTNFMKNQIVWESIQEDIRRPIPRPFVFFGPQRNPNEPPRITEVVRITTDQPYGLDFMEQIIVMRENNKPDSFSEADFKYLNKNDIEDLYYLCRNRKVNYRETKLMNSLITFIRSRVIWERVHDFQLGIESYQIKINLTAPTLTFPEIVKFCDATLENVLKEVKLKIFQSEPWRKPPLLGELDRDILRAFEREITKRLSHREQMRRWESFVNGRPILPTMKRL